MKLNKSTTKYVTNFEILKKNYNKQNNSRKFLKNPDKKGKILGSSTESLSHLGQEG